MQDGNRSKPIMDQEIRIAMDTKVPCTSPVAPTTPRDVRRTSLQRSRSQASPSGMTSITSTTTMAIAHDQLTDTLPNLSSFHLLQRPTSPLYLSAHHATTSRSSHPRYLRSSLARATQPTRSALHTFFLARGSSFCSPSLTGIPSIRLTN